jgi:hypothetical protein
MMVRQNMPAKRRAFDVSSSRAARWRARAMWTCTMLACLSGPSLAQPLPVSPGSATAVNPGTPPPTMEAPATVLAQAAQKVGVRRCYQAINVVSSRTFLNTERTDVVLDWDRQDPDSAPFFSLAGLEYGQNSAVLSLTTTPVPNGGCAILAERISSAPMPCKDVARSELGGYHANTLVKLVTVYTTPGRSRETVTLIDAPPSCVIVRRQVQFGR